MRQQTRNIISQHSRHDIGIMHLFTTDLEIKGSGPNTPQSERKVKASVRIETRSNEAPTLSIPNSTDTINTDASEIASINVTLPNQTELELWMENSGGARVKSIQAKQLTDAGSYEFNWDGTDQQNEIVAEGDYYAVLGYTQLGVSKEIDLRNSTGGALSYYRRPTANPRQFNRLESPLVINYAVDEPAEVSFFWQISFGARLMTLMEHERMGRGQYSLYWNAEYPSGEKVPDSLNNLMPGIVRYALPDNVIFVKSMPRIEHYLLKSTIMADPRRETLDFDITLSKKGTVELVVSDMDKGIEVATRVYPNLNGGQHSLSWDGKNNDDQLLAPGDYRMGVRSVDKRGSRSLFWYRTQRINY
jgi:flagellar hook assembly protein FlgD